MNWNSARGYLWDRALRLLGRRPWRTVAAVVLIAVSLAIPGLALMLGQMLAPLDGHEPRAEATAFVTSGTSASELQALKGRIEAIEAVAAVSLLPRDEAWADLQKRAGTGKGAADLGANPLPDVLVVQFGARVDPDVVEAGATAMSKLPRVDAVQADIEWYRRYLLISQVLVATFSGLAAALTVLLVALLVGAVRSVVAMDALEVRVLEQIGADPDFVRMPCIYGGALIFGLGAAGCLGLLAAVRTLANPVLAGVGEAFGGVKLALAYPAWPLVLAFVALCVICGGAVGSLAAPRPVTLARSAR